MKRSSRRGSVQLKGATVGVDEEDALSFTVESRSKKYRLQGEKQERLTACWIHAHVFSVSAAVVGSDVFRASVVQHS